MKFWPRKKPTPPAVIEQPAATGFFSTDANPTTAGALAMRIARAFKRSIQRGPDDLVTVDHNGAAMDSSIAVAKLVNSSMGYMPIQQLEWYGAQGFIGWQTCAIIAQHWLVDKVCTMPAKDAVRHGWEIEINGGDDIDPKIFDEIRKLDKKYKIKKNCIEFIKQGRVFGIRHALFIVDGIDYELPFNPDGVRPGSYKGITQIDPYWVAPELDTSAASNPAAKDFYEPTWWRVNGKRVHKSHFVIMRNGDELSDILKPSYFYGGIPAPQKIYERVYAAERTANEAPLLAMSKRLTVLNVDITQAMVDPAKFSAKMEEWSNLMNNFGIKVVGETEQIEQFDTNLGGLDETIMTQFQLVAAAGNVPATKLLGTSPKGFNATGEYEESSYHEELESIQENELSPLVERHHLLIMRSDIAPKFGIKPLNTEVRWLPVNSMGAAELADVNLKRAQVDAVYVNAGAIDGFDVRQRLINDRDSGYTGIEDMVPGGVGDREAEQEKQEQALAIEQQGAFGVDSVDLGYFDPSRGTLEGARIITHQKFLDEDKVQEKIAASDWVVNVTPEFEDQGKKYRMVIDGHHSLAAALRSHVRPIFIESVPHEAVYNPVTGMATDSWNEEDHPRDNEGKFKSSGDLIDSATEYLISEMQSSGITIGNINQSRNRNGERSNYINLSTSNTHGQLRLSDHTNNQNFNTSNFNILGNDPDILRTYIQNLREKMLESESVALENNKKTDDVVGKITPEEWRAYKKFWSSGKSQTQIEARQKNMASTHGFDPEIFRNKIFNEKMNAKASDKA